MSLGTQSIGVPDLGLDKIASLVLRVPGSLDEQNRIGALLDSEQRVSDELLLSAKKLRVVKTGLMQDLLTGKRRITALLAEPEGATA
jgi:type I restriction enzyme S subunit